jgi:hypothetical protein
MMFHFALWSQEKRGLLGWTDPCSVPRAMRRNTFNLVIDVVTLLLMLGLLTTGLIIWFVLPPGSGGRHGGAGLTLWGLGRHDWGDVHAWMALTLCVLVVLHVILHWSWACSTVRGLFGKRGAVAKRGRLTAGLVCLLVLAGLVSGFTWLASSEVTATRPTAAAEREPPRHESEDPCETTSNNGLCAPAPFTPPGVGGGRRGRGRGMASGAGRSSIRGSMTLGEVAGQAGMDVGQLKRLLGLPPGVSANERLGRLRRRFGFQMSDVRRAVGGEGG